MLRWRNPLSVLYVVGTTTNDNAAAGVVGQFISSEVNVGADVSLASPNPKTITSISLTAGDWDVWGMVGYIPSATTSITNLVSSVSPTDNVQNTNALYTNGPGTFPVAGVVPGNNTYLKFNTPQIRVSIPGTTTYYLVAQGVFSISTLAAIGGIWARRRR